MYSDIYTSLFWLWWVECDIGLVGSLVALYEHEDAFVCQHIGAIRLPNSKVGIRQLFEPSEDADNFIDVLLYYVVCTGDLS